MMGRFAGWPERRKTRRPWQRARQTATAGRHAAATEHASRHAPHKSSCGMPWHRSIIWHDRHVTTRKTDTLRGNDSGGEQMAGRRTARRTRSVSPRDGQPPIRHELSPTWHARPAARRERPRHGMRRTVIIVAVMLCAAIALFASIPRLMRFVWPLPALNHAGRRTPTVPRRCLPATTRKCCPLNRH